jgi:hypothetical protein
MPTGEHLRFHIGRFENGPAILPIHRFNVWKLGFTPISTVELDKVLRCYPKMDDAELLSFGFKYGFKLHYEGSRRIIETKNLKSVMQNPLAAKEKIENEIQNGRQLTT